MSETTYAITFLFVMGLVAFAMNEIILRWDKRREKRKRRSGEVS